MIPMKYIEGGLFSSWEKGNYLVSFLWGMVLLSNTSGPLTLKVGLWSVSSCHGLLGFN
jgi:hypothetical protein